MDLTTLDEHDAADLAARLAVSAGLEESGEPRATLDAVVGADERELAAATGGYVAAYEAVRTLIENKFN